MRQAIDLVLKRVVQLFLAMAVNIAPQRRNTVQIFPTMIVDQIMAVAAADDHRVLAHPFLHLREWMPKIGVVELF